MSTKTDEADARLIAAHVEVHQAYEARVAAHEAECGFVKGERVWALIGAEWDEDDCVWEVGVWRERVFSGLYGNDPSIAILTGVPGDRTMDRHRADYVPLCNVQVEIPVERDSRGSEEAKV